MSSGRLLHCRRTTWRGRAAYTLGNGILRLTTLTGGGHVAELRLERPNGLSVNPLWSPPWATIDPHTYREPRHRRRYGSLIEGRLLSGIAGHSLCLDYFGIPSAEEVRHGLSLHGEAPSRRWRATRVSRTAGRVTCELRTQLPVAGLEFRRTITLRPDEQVAYFEETVRNTRKADHFFHWTQHVTLGPPFLAHGDTQIALPGTRGLTFPHGYDEGKALLASNREFQWPDAPRADGSVADLTQTLIEPGLGFVVGVLLADREVAFVAALNRTHRLMLGYCFRRADFPWVAIWEEHRAISAPPWKGRTEARGLEFGTTPLPVTRREAFLASRLFEEPTMACVPASGRKSIRYLAFLTDVPTDFGTIRDIAVDDRGVRVLDDAGRSVAVRSAGLGGLLAP